MSAEHTSRQLDSFFKSFLDIEDFTETDNSLNGIQVDNDGSAICKIAFGVDAAIQTFEKAAAINAGMLFVHHGLFWGPQVRISGNIRQRIKFLLDRNICLYAVHLPLDQHPKLGNNAALAELLCLENIEPFGPYHSRKIGYKGTVSAPLTTEEAAEKINFMGRPPLGMFSFGRDKNTSIAVMSGGAADNTRDAINDGLDLYVTGELSHQVYHDCLEAKINVIAGGHYNTEVWGARKVMDYCKNELDIDVEFIDNPTGL
ncbi:MAG: Nif3-like dinuclear metal center hexameric protein [Treponema sp.]|jgi:dinuclear metal center YbgI/SA1388 family protein|nr:Nif3-like dinuclear metal center hexameric protein [Treponema sp.]